MISWKKQFMAFLCLVTLLGNPAILHAASLTDAFNPNFLISDEELQDAKSMSSSDIQLFLNEQGGYISRLRTPDKDGITRTVADIIYNAAQEHTINPKYLLVKLQKEQSLITDADPTQKALDGATGYGITDGCGWSCDTYKRNKGFGKQVDSAAGIMRWYYDNIDKSWIRKPNVTYTISNEQVTPANNATAFLYTYTPHIQGNKNFWVLWQRWFEQLYPDGTIIQAPGSDTVYLLKDGKKYPFASKTALTTRYNPNAIITVPTSELGRYATGAAIELPNYAILKNNSTYYLLDNETIRPFASYDVVKKLGYHPDEIIPVSSSEISQFRKGDAINVASNDAVFGRLLEVTENGALYYEKDGVLHALTDKQMAQVNFPHLAFESVSISTLGSLKMGDPQRFKDGTLLLIEGDYKVYVIENGKKRHITTEDVFVGLGYDWNNIITTNEYTGLMHDTADPLYLRRVVQKSQPDIITADSPAPATQTPTPSSPFSVSDEIAAKMIRTPAADTAFIGPTYDTHVDTYLVADAESLDILAGKNIDAVRPIASFAKVLTAYQLQRSGLSMTKVTTYNAAEHKAMYHRFRIAQGESVFNKDLLDAMMVSSLNTPVRMLVDSVEKNESTFIANMNALTSSWGLKNTTYVDVTGENEHTVSTAREYLTIFHKSIKNSHVKTSLGKASYKYTEYKDLDDAPDHFDDHTNKLTRENLPYTILASKTGYLHESGAGLVMLVKRKSDGKQFYIITMGNVDYGKRFTEPRAFANWAMKTF